MVYGPGMRRGGWRWVGWLALTGLAGVQAEVVESPTDRFQVIVVRNAFSLTDPPTNTAVGPQTAPPPPIKVPVQLSGISVRGGKKYAWLVMPPTPGVSTNIQYWKVEEGGQQGDYSITSIDPRARLVTLTLKSTGQTTTLDLGSNAPPMMSPAVVPGAGAVPGKPGVAVPGRPGVNPAVPRAPGQAPGVNVPSAIPTPMAPGVQRSASISVPNSSVVGGNFGGTVNVGAGVRTVTPTRQVRTVAQDVQPDMDPAEQYIMMRRQEAAARAAGVELPPVPPIPGLE